ncbi:MAG: hypothetical protein ACOCUI_00325 [bacterium]
MVRKTIAFIGIDGAGKTTIINEIEKILKKQGIKCKRRYMGLGREYDLRIIEKLIQIYRRLKRGKSDKRKSADLPGHNYRQRGFFWVAVQYLELWARHIKSRFNKSEVTLFDRYFYDGLILTNRRSFNFFRFITPKPTKAFLLYSKPKVIRSRKKEARIKDIKEFYMRFNRLKSKFDIEIIDNNKNLKEVVKEIVKKIKWVL